VDEMYRILSPNRPSKNTDYSNADGELAKAMLPKSPLGKILFEHDGYFVCKWFHYIEIYEREFQRFRDGIITPGQSNLRPTRFLEIGVSKGGSLEVWKKYFSHGSTIFGIDIDPNCSRISLEGVSIRIGSQTDRAFLLGVVAEMGGIDVVLDDGSHRGEHQTETFELLWPLLNEGGLYIVEDLHTAYWSEFGDGYKKSSSFIEFSKDLVDAMHYKYTRKRMPHRVEISKDDISRVSFFDSVVVLEKIHRAEPKKFGLGEIRN